LSPGGKHPPLTPKQFLEQSEETDFFDFRREHDFCGIESRRPRDGTKIYLRHASGGDDGPAG
jgi:hypothetical protein